MAVSPLDSLCAPHGRIRTDLAPVSMDVDEYLKIWLAQAESLAAANSAAQKIYVEFQFYDYLYTTFIFVAHRQSSLQRSDEYTNEQVKLITEFYARVKADYESYFGGETQIKAFAGVKR